MESKTLIFLHIPKTAGVSLSKILARQFKPDQVFHVRDNREKSAPYFSRHHGTLEDFKKLSVSDRRQFRCVLGHMYFGIHKYIPGPSSYFALMREPIERIFSQQRQHNKTARLNPGGSLQPKNLPEYWDAYKKPMSNFQTRLLCGQEIKPHDPSQNLIKAKQHLADYFCVCGTTERFEESLLVLAYQMGWQSFFFGRHNVSARIPGDSEVCADVLDEMKRCNTNDKELFDYANQLLDQAVLGYGEEFEKDLARMKSNLKRNVLGYHQDTLVNIKRKYWLKEKILSMTETVKNKLCK